ncbi:hypothetical protein ACFPRL_11335 [Pseudoclavibacter helvolus]
MRTSRRSSSVKTGLPRPSTAPLTLALRRFASRASWRESRASSRRCRAREGLRWSVAPESRPSACSVADGHAPGAAQLRGERAMRSRMSVASP